MQWILQDFEDTQKLAAALDRLEISYSWHKVIPFVGQMTPEPEIANPDAVVIFGAYSLWRYAEEKGLTPGVFRISPFVHEEVWQPFLLNGPGATFLRVDEILSRLPAGARQYFVRPVADSKEQAGVVKTADEIRETARKVMSLEQSEIPQGSLRPETMMMLTRPAPLEKEWRIWVVGGQVITYSLYKDGSRVVYRGEIDDDALAFAQQMADLNPDYAAAYVLDICRTDQGLRLLETNCINAAGFYAADLDKLAAVIDAMA